MSKQLVSPIVVSGPAIKVRLDSARESEAVRQSAHDAVALTAIDDGHALAPGERDQIARDIADIERATAVLRKAEPALELWIDPPTQAVSAPGPVWLLIGLLWLSTALVTVGAVVTIVALVG